MNTEQNLKFHVTFGTSKKIVKVQSNEEIVDVIFQSFELDEAFDLKYFNKDFEDWVDVEELNAIPPMSRLQVIGRNEFVCLRDCYQVLFNISMS